MVVKNLAHSFRQYLMLSDENEFNTPVEKWRISALRIIIISGYLLYSCVAVHSFWASVFTNVSFIIPLTLGFYLVGAAQLWLSNHYYKIAAYSLLLTIISLACCINLIVKDPTLAIMGPIFVFSLPLAGFILLGTKAGLICMLLNIIPLIALINGYQLSQFMPDHVRLEHAKPYLLGLIFIFYNVCGPLAVARASLAAKRLNTKTLHQNTLLQNQSDFYRTLFLDTDIAKLVVNNDGVVTEMNKSAEKLLQIEFTTLPAPIHVSKIFPELPNSNSETIIRTHISGKMKAFKLNQSTLFNRAYYFLTIQDITAKILLQKTLAAQTLLSRSKDRDSETGLLNRRHLEQRLNILLSEKTTGFCLIAFSISNPHFIEQKFGYHIVPLLLKKLAEYWQSENQTTILIGMLDRNKIAAVTSLSLEQAQQKIAHLLDNLPNLKFVDDQSIPADIKVGVAFCDNADGSAEKLVNNAIYAISSSTLPINFYETASLERFIEHQEINILLSQALVNNELSVVYQPKVKGDGELLGIEALLRWNSPILGVVSPALFIPIAEKSGLVIQVTKWLITEICRQIVVWQNAGLTVVPIAINISGPDLDQQNFHEHLVNSLVELKIRPQMIELELTESARSINLNKALETVKYLDNWGFNLTLDDFGIGYSGLSKLISYPIRRVKIDRQFIKGIHKDNKKAQVVEAMVAMCHVFEIEILAEGVELFEEVDKLLQLGCMHFQGYVFAKPLPANQIADVLRAGYVPLKRNTTAIEKIGLI